MNNRKRREKKHKFITKGHGKEPTVIEFNLSKAVIVCITIIVLITTVITAKVITTIIEANKKFSFADSGANEENVIWVDSTDENPVKVPVPKGYVASKIPGETTVNGGFVIYEDNYNGQPIDWDSILVETTNNNIVTNSLDQSDKTIETNTEATIDNQSNNSEEIKTEEVSSNTEQTTILDDTTQSVQKETFEIQSTNDDTENNINKIDSVNPLTEETEKIVENNSNSTELEKDEKQSTEQTNQEQNEEVVKETQKTESTDVVNGYNVQSLNEENNIEDNTTSTDENNNEQLLEDNSVEELSNDNITQQDINIFDLQKSTNQYVWIPVKDISRIYGVDDNKKLYGKLYDYDNTGRVLLEEQDGLFEPGLASLFDNDAIFQSVFDGKTHDEFLFKELEEDFYKTIKSIQKYGGFYVGRYETGGLSENSVVRKMNTDTSNQTWYAIYEKIKSLKGANGNIETLMIWGSLWDEILMWLLESGATISDGSSLTYSLINESTSWGNYLNSEFNYIPENSQTPEATEEKKKYVDNTVPTGSSDYTKINNIYDLAGNVYEYTAETAINQLRVIRGGIYNTSINFLYSSVAFRNAVTDMLNKLPFNVLQVGSRAILLIK